MAGSAGSIPSSTDSKTEQERDKQCAVSDYEAEQRVQQVTIARSRGRESRRSRSEPHSNAPEPHVSIGHNLTLPARGEWTKILSGYRTPSLPRSLAELAATGLPLAALWTVAWFVFWLGEGWASPLLAIPAAGFLVRLFMIQHDCGHGTFFSNRSTNDWVGRIIGVLTLTPYAYWRRTHAMHHATAGNLDRRGMGDIDTLTLREYRAMSGLARLRYRLYRNPFVMFGIGPAFLFLLQHRLPLGLMRSGWGPWLSTMGTNFAVASVVGLLIWLIGFKVFLLVHLPTLLLAASAGVWLFYVQHQFESTSWERNGEWTLQDAALHGSSFYDLPPVLRWLTANIGIHHVHHLCSRIPFYRLATVLREHPELREVGRLTWLDSIQCVRLALWDEQEKRLVSFRDAQRSARGRK